VDLQLAKQYYRQLLKLQDEFNLPGDITPEILTRLPGILVVEEQRISEGQIWPVLEQALTSALAKLDSMKQTEGAALYDDLQKRLETIKELLSKIRDHSADFVTEYNQKLQKRLQELLEGKVEIDESRIIIEAGILAERADITEEIVRLESHCAQFAECLNSKEPVGRQLDFLLQEMLRESNTIGSKAGSTQIVNHAVDTALLCVLLKTEIERMRELAQNVE
jgi:uncharacterized protein (TIGR00255 family)